jgi:hypothetical protein
MRLDELEDKSLAVLAMGVEEDGVCGRLGVGIVGFVGQDSVVRRFGRSSSYDEILRAFVVFDFGVERIQVVW